MTTRYGNPALEGFDFFKKLLPSFEKRKLLAQLDLVRSELNELVIPLGLVVADQLEDAGYDITKTKHGNRVYNDLKKRIQRLGNPEISGSELKNVCSMFANIAVVLSRKEKLLRTYIEKNFSNIIVKDGLSFKQAHVIRLIDLMVFYINEYMSHLNMIVHEIIEGNGYRDEITTARPTNEKLVANYNNFATLTEVFMDADKDFLNMIESTSDMNIAEIGDSEIPMVDSASNPIDRNRLGFMPVIGTVILQVQNWNVSRQIEKYERNKLLKQSLELRLLNAKQRKENGDADPALEKTIDSLASRIQKIDYEIEKFEKSAGV